jgi:CRP-like cAMP-binding protein
MQTGPYVNTLLRHMDSEVISRLQLRRIDLPLRFELETPGASISNLYFIEEGIGSMTTCFENGVQVETSMFGYESVVGVSALMGVKHSLNRIFMQLSGYGYVCGVNAAHAEFNRNGIFQRLALRYVQAQLTLSTQNAACNATHTYEQRLARWLLICSDRAKQNSFEMAQEFVSEMLGSTRSTVSIAAAHFKAKGLIDYRRGNIALLDKVGLEGEACECYRVVREHLENLTEFDTGFVV